MSSARSDLGHRASRTRAVALALGATVLLAAGCSTGRSEGVDAGDPGDNPTSHVMADGTTMSDSEMERPDMEHSGAEHSTALPVDAPSEAAAMICTDETRDAVVRTFDLAQPPLSSDDWSNGDRVYSCTYDLPAGDLRLTVQDGAEQAGAGARTYFDQARARLDGARRISGLESFGFPAVETEDGHVIFLKDGKTLRVDASSLRGSQLPDGFSRSELAYSVAAAVIACWTE